MSQKEINKWAENVSKAYDILAFGNTERALEILGKTRNEMRKFLAKKDCNYPNCSYPCMNLPDCQDKK